MPRLKSGETATGVAAKAQACSASTKARIAALVDVLERHEDASVTKEGLEILARFRSLKECAAWSQPELAVHPLSEKTLRQYLEKNALPFDDAKRKAMAKLLEKKNVDAPELTSPEQPQRNDRRIADGLLMMTAQYLDLLERLNRLRHGNEDIDDLLVAHFRLYEKPQKAKPDLRVIQ